MADAERTFSEQVGNIGSELGRAVHWQEAGNKLYRDQAIERALDLLDHLLSSESRQGRLREIARLRELVADQLSPQPTYACSIADLQRYCLPFALLTRGKM